MLKFVFVCIIIIHSIFSLAQDSIKKDISLSFGMNRMDFFSGIHYSKIKKNFIYSSAFEVGVNKTFFQHRFFPRISFGVSYDLFKGSKFQVSPILNYSLSILNVNKETTDIHYFNEIYLGYSAEFGSRIKLYQTTQIGSMQERFKNDLDNIKTKTFVLGYFIAIGVKYEI